MNSVEEIKWCCIFIICLLLLILWLISRNNMGKENMKNMGSNNMGNNMNNNMGKNNMGNNMNNNMGKNNMNNNNNNMGNNRGGNNQPNEMTLYYASWCGHCKTFLPQWNSFQQQAKNRFPNLKVSTVQCDGSGEAACNQKGIKGFPTIVLFSNGQEKLFDGDRSVNGLNQYVSQNM
jgi:thiol-disulfide isomerase/thioredoxin